MERGPLFSAKLLEGSMSPKKPTVKRRRLAMRLEAPNSKEVSLMADFNNWDAGAHPMKRNEDGSWGRVLILIPGRYEYKFLVDGEWSIDPKNCDFCLNCFGTQNNVMVIC